MNASNQVVFISGASSGMGKDFALTLLKEGYKVAAAARRVEQMEDLKDLGALTLKMDVTSEEDVLSAVEQVKQQFGQVDVLINNAGFGLYGAMEDIPLADARYQFEVNLFGLARLTQALLPGMRERKRGRIINISSMGGKIYTPLGSWYHATKHALEGWSDCLRLELREHGIQVVLIEPGAIETEFGDVMSAPMQRYSGEGPYAEYVQACLKMVEEEYNQGGGSPPKVITDLVLKAIRSDKPRTRYSAGKYARSMMWMRKWMGDRVFDWSLNHMTDRFRKSSR